MTLIKGAVPERAIPDRAVALYSLPATGFQGYTATVRSVQRPIGAYSPPNTLEETADQLKTLADQIDSFDGVVDLQTTADTADLIEQVNTMLRKMKGITKGAQ